MTGSKLTSKSEEVANIKLKYEEQLESLKTALRKEQSKTAKFVGMFTQKQIIATDIDLSQSRSSLLNTQQHLSAIMTSQRTMNDAPLLTQRQTNDFPIDEYENLLEDMTIQMNEKDCLINLLKSEVEAEAVKA